MLINTGYEEGQRFHTKSSVHHLSLYTLYHTIQGSQSSLLPTMTENAFPSIYLVVIKIKHGNTRVKILEDLAHEKKQ